MLTRYKFIEKLWKITNRYQLDITTECMAICMSDKYNNYSYELLYVSIILSAKTNEDGLLSLQKMVYKLKNTLMYQMEIDLIPNIKNDNFLNQLTNHLIMYNARKRLGVSFIELVRYLTWYDIQCDFYTIILAIKILKKYNCYKLDFFIKFHHLYKLFYTISKMYDVTIKSLADEYYKLKCIKNNII